MAGESELLSELRLLVERDHEQIGGRVAVVSKSHCPASKDVGSIMGTNEGESAAEGFNESSELFGWLLLSLLMEEVCLEDCICAARRAEPRAEFLIVPLRGGVELLSKQESFLRYNF